MEFVVNAAICLGSESVFVLLQVLNFRAQGVHGECRHALGIQSINSSVACHLCTSTGVYIFALTEFVRNAAIFLGR